MRVRRSIGRNEARINVRSQLGTNISGFLSMENVARLDAVVDVNRVVVRVRGTNLANISRLAVILVVEPQLT